ncbi:MAG: amidohydrolase family protein [Bdellovibrionales bacterium]|nr:amidohydrolase family protein [Bdellovibrionales bacterium]
MARKKQLIVRASQLFDGERFHTKKTIVIEGDRIVDVVSKNMKSDFEGIVTPAFIDPHSHIGMFRSGEPESESEGNDSIHQIRPNHDPLNAVYFDDRTFQDAVDFGVLYSCIIPGSGNLFGGISKVIRNFASNRSDAELCRLGYKMALGFNPRSTRSWQGERPSTRMGVYAMLERHFDDVLQKFERETLELERKKQEVLEKKELASNAREEKIAALDKEFNLKFTTDESALLDALSGEPLVKVHVHKEDDVLYLLELKERYGLRITAEHLIDVRDIEIFRACAREGVSIVYGPIGCYNYKTELKHGFYQNVEVLRKSKAFFGLMTDHPVIHATALRDSLKYLLISGASSEEALATITQRNAEVLDLGDYLGRVAPNYLASILVWKSDPLHLSSIPSVVIGEGQVLRKG